MLLSSELPKPPNSRSKVAAIRLQNLTLGYERHPAVHHLDVEVMQGSLMAIVGPNGSGKSTLLKALSGELSPMEGSFHMPLHKKEPLNIAYLPQQSDLDRRFPISVFDLVAMGLWRRIGGFRGLSASQRNEVRVALARVGLQDFARRSIDTLSGGQLQRALFARLLLQDAQVILLDEPFNAIDQKTAADLLNLLGEWHGEGRTVLAALHDIGSVRDHFPQTLLLARELIACGKTEDVLKPANLLKARRLCEAFDENAPVCRRKHRSAA